MSALVHAGSGAAAGAWTRDKETARVLGRGEGQEEKMREEPEQHGDLPKVTLQHAGREPGAWLLSLPRDLSAGLSCSR